MNETHDRSSPRHETRSFPTETLAHTDIIAARGGPSSELEDQYEKQTLSKELTCCISTISTPSPASCLGKHEMQ
jgi:hypothetical protein